jgi:uncharacterized protein YjiS (DUF1127 family)
MSTLFNSGNLAVGARHAAARVGHQYNSWLGLLETWLVWEERRRQRAALREIADDPHLLSDLGFTRAEALAQANKPFWR